MDKFAVLFFGVVALALVFVGFIQSRQQIQTTPSQKLTDQAIKTITIKAGNFFWEGPDGKSGTNSKTPVDITPQVVAKLKNGEKVKLVFENIGGIEHEVISPLFSAPEEKRFVLGAGEKVEIEFTPQFLTPEEGGTVTFDLWCHVRHLQSTDHYRLGMRALIQIVP